MDREHAHRLRRRDLLGDPPLLLGGLEAAREVPRLPQRFPAEQAIKDDDNEIRRRWWEAGFKCVVITYGSYHGMQPIDFPRIDPYGVYTGNDTGGDFAAWGSAGENCHPCKDSEEPPVQRIGSQDGIEATYNRLKAMDPEGCNPAFNPKQPAALPIDSLKAYDKWFRTMKILVQDHDAAV